jgi:Xaa-Pro aminopeptidase
MEIIEVFRNKMESEGYKAYIIPTSDYHNSEYISDYFKARQYLSGFTGSQGTLLITKEFAYLWVDGRYFIQAEKQVNPNYIKIMKIGTLNTPTIEQFLNDYLKDNDVLGFDGRLMSTNLVKSITNTVKAGIVIKDDVDLVNSVWPDRPNLPFSLLYNLDLLFTGKDYQKKVEELRIKISDAEASMHIITSLEDIAWLLNLRGNDISHTPVFLSYFILTQTEAILFVDKKKLNPEVKAYLKDNNIKVKDYFDFYEYIKTIGGKNILIDLNKANYRIYSSINQRNTIINKQNPTLLMKSIKNETEIRNIKLAHNRDGALVAKLMYYVKSSYDNKAQLSEISASDYIDKLRSETKGFVDLSFNTISAFADHGAMMHYSATPETNYEIDKPGFLLVDSGGHYLEGTTDITRTFGVGKINDEMKTNFTLVLKSMINLSKAVFLKGCNGQNLDILARGPIWNELMDYKCGTGHGVGYLLSVHEAPNGFRWQRVAERNDSAVFEPGMVTTNEPGIYLENKYGIRIENEMLCVPKGQTEFGEFLTFETITFAPIDLDCIKVTLLTKEEKAWLNEYHELVYKKINKYLTKQEKDWLKIYTRKL